MKTGNLSLAILASVVIGIAQTFMLLYCWAYIGAYMPLPNWLMSLGVHGISLQTSLFVLNFLISVALCLPAALALCLLRPRKLLVYLTAAVIPGFLWQNRLLFQDPSVFREFGQFMPGILAGLLVLPVAVALLSRVLKQSHA